MSDAYVPESRWRMTLAALLVGGGLLLGGVVVVRGMFGGGSEGASSGTDVRRVAFVDAEGNRRTLADFQGKVVLVDVWATWCPPCRKSLPEVAELQKAGGDGYVVLPISVDNGGWGDVKPFLAQNPQLGLTAYLPDGAKALEPFGEISGIPTTILVDRRGRLVQRWSGYAEGMAQRALDEALKAK
ncbi:TlpA disulfide reductase family protein [Geothrix sp. PMB-07]|uniref:TlpA family protein disulfide reductase n=1 Tax=Geothrix sp. PMB-07 TaxID=3068640 RepID=UPI00274135F9|nr:TlpA disulfide reductase family protein [Geothrix sp. PMB-07]WLT32438.1 TlpA disulfide reductase family protein [Geothrix sp. PMB-07]